MNKTKRSALWNPQKVFPSFSTLHEKLLKTRIGHFAEKSIWFPEHYFFLLFVLWNNVFEVDQSPKWVLNAREERVQVMLASHLLVTQKAAVLWSGAILGSVMLDCLLNNTDL